MKKLKFILSLLLTAFLFNDLYAQLLSGQSTENSTIILQGSTIGFKPLKEGEVAFSAVSNPLRICNIGGPSIPSPFFGVFLNAKSQEGIAGIFSEGKFQPAARALGVAGLNFNIIKNYNTLECDYIAERRQLKQLNEDLGLGVIQYITDQLVKNITNDTRRKPLTKYLINIIDNDIRGNWGANITAFAAGPPATFPFILNPPEVALINAIAATVSQRVINYEATQENLKAADRAFDAVKDKPVGQLKVFFLLRQRAEQFYTLETLQPSNPFSSFTKQYYGRADVGVGANLILGGTVMIGATYGNRVANNLATLTKGDYTLTNIVSDGTQRVVEERKRTAYLGKYQEFKQEFFNIDLLFFTQSVKGKGNNSKTNVIFNPYFRHEKSRDKNIQPNVSTLGITTLYRGGKGFIGGIYVEGYDLKNNLDKFKAQQTGITPNLTPLYNRLSFGIITQFELISILNP